jgi:hypothetical protein
MFNAYNDLMNTGFSMKFDNGYTISVQFDPITNHCSNGKDTAECAVFNPDGDIFRLDDWDQNVKGWMKPKEVLELMNRVESM